MSQHRKLVDRIIAKPRDFTWDELKALLSGFGYREASSGKTVGSRRRFVHERRGPIILHKPQPGSELKSYQVSQIVTHLKVEGLI
jgi:hypothetical protein